MAESGLSTELPTRASSVAYLHGVYYTSSSAPNLAKRCLCKRRFPSVQPTTRWRMCSEEVLKERTRENEANMNAVDDVKGGDIYPEASSVGFALADAPLHLFVELQTKSGKWEAPGAYAVRDTHGTLCYIGYTKNIAKKLLFHLEQVPEQCTSFQVYIPPVPLEAITPDMLEGVLEYWVRENGCIPLGNTRDGALWEGTGPSRQSVSQSSDKSMESTASVEDIPVRARKTPKRVVHERASPGSEGLGSGFGADSSRRDTSSTSAPWDAEEGDYVEIDVDPLDPFSATSYNKVPSSVWGSDDDKVDDDWIPIIGLMGVAALIWFVTVIGNTLPATAPSSGF